MSKPNGYKSGYQGASGVRGNPWANAGAQWAPPPKPPGANRRPPPSGGAARYAKFETPRAANATYEGAEARKKTYEAWESMRSQETRAQASANRESYKPPPPSRDYTNTSGRDESNSYKHAAPPKPKPGFDEYRANYSPNISPHRRAQSMGAANRRGFTPATPGGDEPAAPKGAYFTEYKSQYAPVPSPRAQPAPMHDVQSDPLEQNVPPDPLRQFRQQVDPLAHESRQRTPYQTHGGEKLNPFDNANLNRSKSHREDSKNSGGSAQVPRTGSDSKLSQPHRTRSKVDQSKRPMKTLFTEDAAHSSSSEDATRNKSPNLANSAHPGGVPTGSSKDRLHMPSATEHSRKPSLSQFQKWYRDNPDAEPPLKGFPPDKPSSAPGQANAHLPEESNMYGTYQSHLSASKPAVASNRLENYSASEAFHCPMRNNNYSPRDKIIGGSIVSSKNMISSSLVTTPSGVAANGLNLFEAHQYRLVEELISERHANGPSLKSSGDANQSDSNNGPGRMGFKAQKPSSMGSLPKKQKYHWLRHLNCPKKLSSSMEQQKPSANLFDHPFSFSLKVDNNTFATTNPRPNGVATPNTENINTKFTSEEWDGKFEAGHDYFRPEHNAAGFPPQGRAQSASRSRGRSPIKIRPFEHKFVQPHAKEVPPMESPGGTKFTPEEWAQSFKPQTFMPSLSTTSARSASSWKGRWPSVRLTMGGNAAVVEDSDNTTDEVPLFTGRKSAGPHVTTSPGLDPMEVDSTPPSEPVTSQAPNIPTPNTVPSGVQSPGKRAAAPSLSPVDSTLKVEFDDLKVRDLISTLNLPIPPVPPKSPVNFTPEYTRPTKAAYEVYLADFKIYMHDWDLFTNQFAYHILARKKQNDDLGSARWEDDKGLAIYRTGLKEDKFVLSHWGKMVEKHEGVMKECAIWKERMKPRNERERPRKKTH